MSQNVNPLFSWMLGSCFGCWEARYTQDWSKTMSEQDHKTLLRLRAWSLHGHMKGHRQTFLQKTPSTASPYFSVHPVLPLSMEKQLECGLKESSGKDPYIQPLCAWMSRTMKCEESYFTWKDSMSLNVSSDPSKDNTGSLITKKFFVYSHGGSCPWELYGWWVGRQHSHHTHSESRPARMLCRYTE